jgi:putative glutathione S-transferase
MGRLIEGRWSTEWYDTEATKGAFERSAAQFRNWVTPDGAPGPTGRGGFAASAGRYHLYVSYACPWAHRTLIYRALKGLDDLIGVSVVHPDMLDDGWTFATGFAGATGDLLHGLPFLRDLYTRADPQYSGRVTVPVLWDRQGGTIVSNESADIIRMLETAFDGLTGNTARFRPEGAEAEIDALNARIYETVNNGVYRAGFATRQEPYDAAVTALFDTLDMLEDRLATRRFLLGDAPTEADWRLFPTLARFDTAYHGHFKCNRARIVDYPNLWAYTRDLWQWPGVGATLHLDHVTRHYHYSHETINPHRIVPVGPRLDFAAPHGREGLQLRRA